MDEYLLKEYVLQDVENYIKEFLQENGIDAKIIEEVNAIQSKLPLKRKLQDSLLTLRKINAPLELDLMIKHRLEELNKEELS